MEFKLYRTLKFIIKPFFMLNHRVKIVGLENIPAKGPVILAGNHKAYFDALIMLAGPKRIVHMMAKKELFKYKFSNAFFRDMGCIPVDRQEHDENAKKEAFEVLKAGKVLGIFPEGTTKKKVDLLPFKYGAVSLAKKAKALLVPFAITGCYNPFKGGVTITYGKGYNVTGELEKENTKLRNIVKKMMKVK